MWMSLGAYKVREERRPAILVLRGSLREHFPSTRAAAVLVKVDCRIHDRNFEC